jgi:hypothetical protein
MTPASILLLLLASTDLLAEDAAELRHAPVPGDAPAAENGEAPSAADGHASPPPAIPASTSPILTGEARFEALMRFRHEHLAIRGSTSWTGGGATVIHGGWGWGWGPHFGWGWSPSVVIRDPVEPRHEWAVYQGVQRLGVPGYLEEVGDQLRLNALEQDLRRTGRRQTVGYGVGVAGLAATVVGFVAAAWAENEQELVLWNTVATGGLCAGLVGTLAGSSAASRARRLQSDYPYTVSYDDTRDQVDAYNESLRKELGLSRQDAYEVITERPPRPER